MDINNKSKSEESNYLMSFHHAHTKNLHDDVKSWKHSFDKKYLAVQNNNLGNFRGLKSGIQYCLTMSFFKIIHRGIFVSGRPQVIKYRLMNRTDNVSIIYSL